MKMLEQAGHTTYTRIVKVLLQRMEQANHTIYTPIVKVLHFFSFQTPINLTLYKIHNTDLYEGVRGEGLFLGLSVILQKKA